MDIKRINNIIFSNSQQNENVDLFIMPMEKQMIVDTFISKVYAYKDKRVEIEWNFSMDCGNNQAAKTT